jgi:phosphoribosylaminoimidazole carboxylase PurE protein
MSAHRAPEAVRSYALRARERGLRVLVAGAGAAAHLPGVLASLTTLPVIGVPLAGTPLGGFDALLSIVQMPPGIPVATVAVGEMGARNAAHLAARILALSDPSVAEAVERVRGAMRETVQLPEG